MKILNIKRYEIYFADLNPTIGGEIQKIRPVVIVSQDEMNKYLELVVICPLTSKLHPKWRTRLQIKCAKKDAEIAVDQIRTSIYACVFSVYGVNLSFSEFIIIRKKAPGNGAMLAPKAQNDRLTSAVRGLHLKNPMI